MNASPAPGVCQTFARSCHSYLPLETLIVSLAKVCIRSGRVKTTRSTRIPPQSCPTRSNGLGTFSSSRTSHARYASFVAEKSLGIGVPNPGKLSARVSRSVMCSRTPSQSVASSGTPWTKTTGRAIGSLRLSRLARSRWLLGCVLTRSPYYLPGATNASTPRLPRKAKGRARYFSARYWSYDESTLRTYARVSAGSSSCAIASGPAL